MNIDTHPAPGPLVFDLAARGLGVLVGFDGSTQSLLALHYGALEAQRSHRVMTVITAISTPLTGDTLLDGVPERFQVQAALDAAKIILNDATRYLKNYAGKVNYRAERGDATAVLVELSMAAELVVIGARGRGGFLGRILGSVATALPAHAHCPTIVVPRGYSVRVAEGAARFTPPPDPRPVILGTDGSQHSRVALLHAARAAQDRDTTLHLVMVIPSLEGWLDWYPDLDIPDQGFIDRRQSQLEGSLYEEAAWVITHFPSVAVTAAVKPGDPVAQLRKATEEAQLTVVGTRGRGKFAGALLGSVSRGALLRATGPVMVVPFLQDHRLSDQTEPTR